MTGVVLCGGQSTRMGTDKGLLKWGAFTWAVITVNKLKGLTSSPKISVNKEQVIPYSGIFESPDLIADNDSLKIKGPLCGILSTHLRFPTEDLLVLACDMVFMETEILEILLRKQQQMPGSEAIVFTNDGDPEPLCGIYTSKGLARVYNLYKEDRLQKQSMKYILEQLPTTFVPIQPDQKKYFFNLNSPGDISPS